MSWLREKQKKAGWALVHVSQRPEEVGEGENKEGKQDEQLKVFYKKPLNTLNLWKHNKKI